VNNLTDLLKKLVEAKGGKQTEIAKSLGISAQRLGQYLQGRQQPKIDFYNKWKDVYGEDIQQMLKGEQTNVSRGTLTVSLDDLKGKVYTELVEGKTEYILQHKRFLDEYQVVPKRIIEMLSQSSAENADLKDRYNKTIQELKEEIAALYKKYPPPDTAG
jgi:transcriptional regulator with XRE-family HTH domain